MALDVASGLALILSIIAFFFSSYAVIQTVQNRRPASPTGNSSGGGGNPVAAFLNQPLPSFLNAPNRVEPGHFVQSAYRGAAKVELLSAYRIDNSGQSDLVNLRLRVTRQESQIPGNGDINLADTTVINTRTNQTYPIMQVRTPGNEWISLYRLRQGQSTEATITLQVPPDLGRVDISIPQTEVFRNVPIAAPEG